MAYIIQQKQDFKSYKNRKIMKSFMLNHGNKFCSLRVDGQNITVNNSKIKYSNSFFTVNNKQYNYKSIRRIKQKNKIIYF